MCARGTSRRRLHPALGGMRRAPVLGKSRGGVRPAARSAEGMICSCHNVSKGTICEAIAAESLVAVAGIKACTKAGTGCGSCVMLMGEILKSELKRSGVAITNHLCEHFPHSRQELFHLVKVKEVNTFDETLGPFGRGRGAGRRAGRRVVAMSSPTSRSGICRWYDTAAWSATRCLQASAGAIGCQVDHFL